AAANIYRDDAFARWLSGKLAETQGDYEGLNDAKIDYMKALQIYEADYAQRYGTPVPQVVIEDALRTLKALGADFADELQALQARYPSVQFPEPNPELGEVVLLHMAGEAPY